MHTSRLLAACIVCFLSACGNGGQQQEPQRAGPCIHMYREPVLSIQKITSLPSGATLPVATLSQFTFNGSPITANELVSQSSSNVVVKSNSLECTTPCGFGTAEGRYEFLTSADLHQSKMTSTMAGYSVFSGGCPSASDVGTDISLDLQKQ